MAIWIWHWRRTMLEKGPWIARTEFPHFARRATTCRKCRMPISGQDRGASMACGLIRERFTKTRMRTAERFSRTTKASQTIELTRAAKVSARIKSGGFARQAAGRFHAVCARGRVARAVEQQAGGQAQALRIQASGFELSPRVFDHAPR